MFADDPPVVNHIDVAEPSDRDLAPNQGTEAAIISNEGADNAEFVMNDMNMFLTPLNQEHIQFGPSDLATADEAPDSVRVASLSESAGGKSYRCLYLESCRIALGTSQSMR